MRKAVFIPISVPFFLLLALFSAILVASRDIDPPNTADLVPQRFEVAEADNAYTHFNAAVAAADWPEDDEHLRDLLDGKASDPEYVADLLARNAETFELLVRGLECCVCQCPEVRTLADSPDYLTKWRTLSRLLWLKATYDQKAGRWAEATTACGDLLRLGHLVQKDAGCMVQYLVGLAIVGQGLDAARKVAASPDVPAAELRRLSKAMPAVGPLDAGLVRAFKAEYQMAANTVDDMKEGRLAHRDCDLNEIPFQGIPYLFQPNRTKQLFAEHCRERIELVPLPASQRNLDEIDERLSPKRNGASFYLRPNAVGRIIAALMLPCLNAVIEARSRKEGDLAATRLVVACRRYEIDHGELPPTLGALVPTYLDAVPRDPYDGKPFRYVRDRAIVYSIGQDLVDSGGSQKLPSGEMPDDEDRDRWEAEDAVFPIHGRAVHTNPKR